MPQPMPDGRPTITARDAGKQLGTGTAPITRLARKGRIDGYWTKDSKGREYWCLPLDELERLSRILERSV
jgi:hypothetical protein